MATNAKKPTAKKTTAKKTANKPSTARTHATKLHAHGAKHGAGFMTFVREQGVVGLAIGLAIGTAALATVKVIVTELVSPLVALVTNGANLGELQWVIVPASDGKEEIAIGWGAILASLIVLLATALVVYLIVHFAKLDRLDKKKDA